MHGLLRSHFQYGWAADAQHGTACVFQQRKQYVEGRPAVAGFWEVQTNLQRIGEKSSLLSSGRMAKSHFNLHSVLLISSWGCTVKIQSKPVPNNSGLTLTQTILFLKQACQWHSNSLGNFNTYMLSWCFNVQISHPKLWGCTWFWRQSLRDP